MSFMQPKMEAPQAPPPPAPPPMIGQVKPTPAKKPMTPSFLGAEKLPSEGSLLGTKPGKTLLGQ